MCEPTTLAAASIAATVIGAGASAYGQMKAGEAAQSQANYTAQAAKNNEIVAGQNKQRSLQAGEAAAAQQTLRTQALMGKQRATMAANGLDVNSGSNLDLTTSAADVGYLDALTIRNNAAVQAGAFDNQGRGFGGQAAMATASGANASDAAMMGVGTSIIGGASALTRDVGKFGANGVPGFKWAAPPK